MADKNTIAVFIIDDYIEHNLPIISDYRDKNFLERSHARWAAFEIISRNYDEISKFPEYLTGNELKKPVDIIAEFISEMDYYREIGNSNQKKIFNVAYRTALEIARLFV